MKKLLAFVLALTCALSLMACGKKDDDNKPDPDPVPGPQPTVTTAEFTHGYVDMALELPEGWSWEQVSDNGTDKTEGIRFYKTDDPTVSYTLLCWTHLRHRCHHRGDHPCQRHEGLAVHRGGHGKGHHGHGRHLF